MLIYLFLMHMKLYYPQIGLMANMPQEVMVTNMYLLHHYGCQPQTECQHHSHDQMQFWILLYEDIFQQFGRAVGLHVSSTNTTQLIPIRNAAQMHSKVRREKRGWCAFCSSKRHNLVLNEAIQTKVIRKKSIFTGCKECNVALCTQKMDCWDRWHSQ